MRVDLDKISPPQAGPSFSVPRFVGIEHQLATFLAPRLGAEEKSRQQLPPRYNAADQIGIENPSW